MFEMTDRQIDGQHHRIKPQHLREGFKNPERRSNRLSRPFCTSYG